MPFLVTSVVILCVLALGCVASDSGMDEGLLPVTLPNGAQFFVEIADTDHLREEGLMHRNHLPRDRGMLFVFTHEKIWPFWMKNTLIPLDVLWLDAEGVIVDVAEHMQPCITTPCPLYYPIHVSSFALEISAGRYAEENLHLGMVLTFSVS